MYYIPNHAAALTLDILFTVFLNDMMFITLAVQPLAIALFFMYIRLTTVLLSVFQNRVFS